ncbi:MAG: hypothetical protein IPG43_21355 [Proteobacteria bacterium]|nr:hypothetical protein [Pseudomonadota bacterium]
MRALLVAFALLLAFSEFRYGVARPGSAPASAQQGQVIDARRAAGWIRDQAVASIPGATTTRGAKS